MEKKKEKKIKRKINKGEFCLNINYRHTVKY